MAGFEDWPLPDALEALEVILKEKKFAIFRKIKDKYYKPEDASFWADIEQRFDDLTEKIRQFTEVSC